MAEIVTNIAVKMKKTHLGVDCHPYKYAWFVYCRVELVEDFENWQLTEEPKEATCKRCLAAFEKICEGIDEINGSFEKATAAT